MQEPLETLVGSSVRDFNWLQWLMQGEALLFEYALRLFLALLIFLAGRLLARLFSRLLERALTRRRIDLTIVRFLVNLAYGAGLAVTLIVTLAQLGIQTASFVAVIGAAGLAVGLALQGSLSNFAAGVLMVILRPCRVGDVIDAAGTSGAVYEISLFTTTIKTGDNKTVIIPNADLLNGNIVNYTREQERRIDLTLTVAHSNDLAQVQAVLRELLTAEPRILTHRPADIAVRNLDAGGVGLIVRPWVRTADYWAVHDHLLERIKQRFDAEGIRLPQTQMDVRVLPDDTRITTTVHTEEHP